MPEQQTNNSAVSLLCEGYDDSCVPTNLFVRQGDKVCFLAGGRDNLSSTLAEAVHDDSTSFVITEHADKLELAERADGGGTYVKGGQWYYEGVHQRSDVENVNKRKYPRSIWENLIAKPDSYVQQAVKRRAMTGLNEHPEDGRSAIRDDLSILTTSLTLRDDLKEDDKVSKGVVWGKGEIFNTPGGRILQELSLRRVPWGVSSRGAGSVRADGIVESNFLLRTFDAVHNPSTPGAYPKARILTAQQNESIDDVDLPPHVRKLLADADGVLAEAANGSNDHTDISRTRRMIAVLSGLASLDGADVLDLRVRNRQARVAEQLASIADTAPIVEVVSAAPADEDEDESADDSQVAESATDAGNDDEAAAGQIVLLREQVEDLTRERDARDEKIDALIKANVVAQTMLAEEVEAREVAEDAREQAEQECESLQRQVDAAVKAVTEQSETDVVDRVSAKLTRVLQENPALTRFNALLGKCESETELDEAAKELTAMLRPAASAGPNSTVRRALSAAPSMLTSMQNVTDEVNESVRTAPKKPVPNTPQSREVSQTAMAVRAMTVR